MNRENESGDILFDLLKTAEDLSKEAAPSWKQKLLAPALGLGLGLGLGQVPKLLPQNQQQVQQSEADVYHVRSVKNYVFVIEHEDMRFTVRCKESLVWLDGDNEPPRFMDDHDCTYMHSFVGKSIPMQQSVDKLVFYPWKGKSAVQTADVLDIISEEPISQPSK